jgi:hypothetical protein
MKPSCRAYTPKETLVDNIVIDGPLGSYLNINVYCIWLDISRRRRTLLACPGNERFDLMRKPDQKGQIPMESTPKE